MRKVWSDCSGSGDYVELLGGNGVDTSQMFPVADLCFSLSGLAQMKIGCDNSVVRLVSSGNYVNRVSFQYRLSVRCNFQYLLKNQMHFGCH
ncbi:hypothetical protein fugu_003647 [Takifugu bimaculatus]|uniref:Corticotropin-releasing factor binding protein C-terminal domain-containing protein n=1 Tax=Takifugu bimaculatus TaxID=433685 RepID=A0A4Z2BAM8_9TELE|nr:hypothetical protein fugu_003647 [Takifugu bimaculatus]